MFRASAQCNLSPVSTNNYAVRVGSMFRYGVKRHYLEANPFTGIAKVKSDDEPPEIFTVDELQKLLFVAPPELIPVLALGGFAGLRSAELVRLGWEDSRIIGADVRDNFPQTVVGSLSHEDLVHADNYRPARATTLFTISRVSSIV